MKKSICVLGSILVQFIFVSCGLQEKEIYQTINEMVENETFDSKDFSYTTKDNIKVCSIKHGEFDICYYAKNDQDTYGVISKKVDDYSLNMTYRKNDIIIRLSGDTFQYWCKVDLELNAKGIEEDMYFNKIIMYIPEQVLYDTHNCFNEETTKYVECFEN